MSMNRSARIFVWVWILAGAAPAGVAFAHGQAPAAAPAPPPAAQGPGGAAAIAPVIIGPPAPVPADVTIPRPTPEELAQVNTAVHRFIDGEASSTKALLKKFESLLLLQPPRKNVAATFTQTVQRRGPRHEGFVETARRGNIDVLFHGDSITDWWLQGDANKAMFDKYFGAMRTANFAIAGDTTQGVLWGLKNGEGQGFQPKAIMLMIGTNNAGNTSAEIAEGVGAVVLEMRTDFPDAKILLLAIFPRGTPGDPVRDKIADANRIIARLDDRRHVFYLDIGAKFLDETGTFLPDSFRPDNLHPLAKGYDIWGAAVKDTLAELLKP
jgi:lysophospholipase L1-like esterase